MSVLRVTSLKKIFSTGFWPITKPSKFIAVNNISFELNQGEILGFLGPNGAGKTTTIQMLLGVLTPSAGHIYYFGENFAKDSIHALKRIGYASGYDKLPARLSVTENLDIVGRIYGLDKTTRQSQIRNLLDFFKISHLSDRLTGSLSAGQATRVMLAKAFLANPEIVLLDEPTASLDPDVAHDVRQFILKQRQERKTSILITSHNMDEVTELCDRVLVLKKGEIIADNSPATLANSISKVNVHLTISSDLESAVAHFNAQEINFKSEDNRFTFELDEHQIARYLTSLSEHKILYSQMSIDKPNLEDYFLSIAKESKL